MLHRRRRLRHGCVELAPETSKVKNQYSRPAKGSVSTTTTRTTSKPLRARRRSSPLGWTWYNKSETKERVSSSSSSVIRMRCPINLRNELWETPTVTLRRGLIISDDCWRREDNAFYYERQIKTQTSAWSIEACVALGTCGNSWGSVH